jgi:Protein of unknown function (DUF429)
MRTVGVDLSVAEKGTALAAIEWEQESRDRARDRARVGEPSLGLADEALLDLLAEAEWVGIDAPFGWPEAMVGALHSYATTGRWPAPAKPEFRYRLTDRFALTAWRLAGLREAAFRRSRLRFDRAGADCVLEVYPAAALLLWGLERTGYRPTPRPARSYLPRSRRRRPGWNGSPAPARPASRATMSSTPSSAP